MVPDWLSRGQGLRAIPEWSQSFSWSQMGGGAAQEGGVGWDQMEHPPSVPSWRPCKVTSGGGKGWEDSALATEKHSLQHGRRGAGGLRMATSEDQEDHGTFQDWGLSSHTVSLNGGSPSWRALGGCEGSAHISGVAYSGARILMPSLRRLQKSSSICTPGYGDPPAGGGRGTGWGVMAAGCQCFLRV